MTVIDDKYLQDGFRSLLDAICARLRTSHPKLTSERILEAAQRALHQANVRPETATWDTAHPTRIAPIFRRAFLGVGVRIVATISEHRPPELIVDDSAEGPPREYEASTICISDGERQIFSLDVAGSPLLDKLDDHMRRGVPIEFLGLPIALPVPLKSRAPKSISAGDRANFFLHVLDVRESSSALDRIGATPAERDDADALLKEILGAECSPLQTLVDEIASAFGIVGLDAFPELNDLLEFTVLQALSVGQIGSASARLHGIVVGPPGSGKKLVGLAARALNPVASELAPGKVSLAGLIGASSSSAEGWRSKPGALPQASGGVAILQDAQGWTKATVLAVAPVLQETMEDGIVRDSVAGGLRRTAETALLIDLNRSSQIVRGRGGRGQEAMILKIRPVLSRTDLIIEIPEDAQRAWDIGRRMIGAVGKAGSASDEDELRPLKVLVALLRDRCPVVDLAPVRAELMKRFDEIEAANTNLITGSSEAGDIPARLVISMQRFVVASARAHARNVATVDDVDRAVRFVNRKLAFLRMAPAPSHADTPRPDEWMEEHFEPDEDVSPTQAARDYEAETGMTVDERTMRRTLARIGARNTRKGSWRMPPPV